MVEIQNWERLAVHDLHEPLPFDDAAFDLAMCNSVIQHIEPDVVYALVLPELCRVIRAGGVLLLHFKQGDGVWTLFDKDYGAERSFQLYDVHQVLAALEALGMALIDGAALVTLATECAKANRYEFMLTVNPLVLVGGTGSPVNPIAVL